jgi:hypothetical protein
MSKTDDIKAHKPIELTTVNVLRRLNLTREECEDENNMRRFAATNGHTLPDMIDIVAEARDDDKEYAWKITVYENPCEKEETAA